MNASKMNKNTRNIYVSRDNSQIYYNRPVNVCTPT